MGVENTPHSSLEGYVKVWVSLMKLHLHIRHGNIHLSFLANLHKTKKNRNTSKPKTVTNPHHPPYSTPLFLCHTPSLTFILNLQKTAKPVHPLPSRTHTNSLNPFQHRSTSIDQYIQNQIEPQPC